MFPLAAKMAVVAEPWKIEYKDRQISGIDQDEVLIKVKAAAICGSDLHIYGGTHPAAPLPCAIGHEVCGEVVKAGPGVDYIEEGDRVCIEPIIVCGRCENCIAGKYNRCDKVNYKYRVGDGAFSEFFMAQSRWAHKLPDNVSYEEGSLIEPLSVAVHAVRLSRLSINSSIAIFGCGPIGLLILQVAMASGVKAAFAISRSAYKLGLAKKLGAGATIDPSKEDPLREIFRRTSGLGVDIAFECAGKEETFNQSLKALRRGGTGVVVGVFSAPVKFDAQIFASREISLRGSSGYCGDFPTAIELLSRGAVNLKEIITHRIDFANIEKGFQRLISGDGDPVKVVVLF